MRAHLLIAGLLLAAAASAASLSAAAQDAPKPPEAAPEAQKAAPSGHPAEKAINPAATVTEKGLPEVFYDPSLLPERVQRMRERILEAARTGDIEKLRPVLESNETPPVFSLGETQGDAIEFWKTQSGDGEGREILAILMEILEAGYLHVDKGTPQEMYLWPYFAQYPLDKLTPAQLVELFRILTGQDYADMKEDGTYVFFRAGVGPDGTWHFFVAGD